MVSESLGSPFLSFPHAFSSQETSNNGFENQLKP